ncbi:hypothetical protein PFISCL1PPCAC_26397, partial [Pristionchus fissidentatus]
MVLPVGAPNSQLLPRHSVHARTARYVQQQQPAVIVQHVTQQHHTEIRLDRNGGGFFASGLLRPTRQRAYSMLPLQTSQSSEELTGNRERAPLIPQRSLTRRSQHLSWKHKYYPLSQEEALELMFLLNQQGSELDNQLLWSAQGRAMSVFVPPDGIDDGRKERLSRKMTARRKFSMMVTINEAATIRNGQLE